MSITYGEIKDQYSALGKTSQHLNALLSQTDAMLSEKKKILFVGSGSSFYIARSAAIIAQTRLHAAAMAVPAGDLLLHPGTYRAFVDGAVVVMLSRSGETSEAVQAISAMRGQNASFSVLTITCVSGSTLVGLSDLAIELPWAFDESVCQTRTVSCLYYACVRIVASLSGDRGLADALETVIAKGPAFMETYEPALQKIAACDWTHGVVLGDAEISGLCEEGALAFKEICQLPSNYYHVLDVRHGPMVLIHDKTLVIVALSSASQLEIDLVADIVKRGATVVVCSDLPADIPGAHVLAFGEPLPHAARGLPVIAACQLITYYKSAQTGADPDQPSGLSAWIKL